MPILLIYTVRFIINANQVYNEQSVEVDHTPTVPSTPTKDGFNFTGWYINDEAVDVGSYTVTKDVTIYGKFEQVRIYTVTFEVTTVQSNRYKTDTYNTAQVSGGSFVTAPATPNYTNYTFKGWSLDGTSVIDVRYYPITGDTTFKAVMQHVNAGKKYTVTYYDYYNAVATFTVTWGDLIEKPAGMLVDTVKNLPTNYYFWGWTTYPPAQQNGMDTPTVTLDGFVVTGNITLYPLKIYHSGSWSA